MTLPRLNPLLHNCHHWREINGPKRVVIQATWIVRLKPTVGYARAHPHIIQVAITDFDWLASIPDVSFLKRWSVEVLQIRKQSKNAWENLKGFTSWYPICANFRSKCSPWCAHGKPSINPWVLLRSGRFLIPHIALDVLYNVSYTFVLIQGLLPKALASWNPSNQEKKRKCMGKPQ